ncbi:MAG: hypothetical protein JW821_17595 [Deltaproteobacteria bacterium]|nr:hypothetical protein [Deltaproteobacteria bacterium]
MDLREINEKIQTIRKEAEDLKRLGEFFPALARNASRILASTKMLELNVSDLVSLESASRGEA